MINNEHCSICDEIAMPKTEKRNSMEQNEDISFAVLLALIPAMTMTLFNLMGLI
jgi:hypothetical protein